MLTENQQNVFDVFLHMIEQKQNYLLSSEQRGIGKTYALNELALTLQALGYKVFILTPSRVVEYFAEQFISVDPHDFEGKFTDNSVIITDETRYIMMDDILEYCSYRNIPIVGYVNFDFNIPFNSEEFQREYECSWIKN